MKYIFSALFLTVVVSLHAQGIPQPVNQTQQPEDTTYRPRPKKPDSLKQKFYFRSVRVGTDLISLIRTSVTANQPSNAFTGWEINGDADFGQVYFAVDIGQWGRKFDLKYGNYGHYENSGSYFRIGADINFLLKDPDRNMFFIGARYGQAYFREDASLIFPAGQVFTIPDRNVHNGGVTASWFELTTGLRVKIWKEFWMGYTARMKFAPSAKGDNEFTAFDIPGYGFYGEGLYWGFNYQIFYRFPIRK